MVCLALELIGSWVVVGFSVGGLFTENGIYFATGSDRRTVQYPKVTQKVTGLALVFILGEGGGLKHRSQQSDLNGQQGSSTYSMGWITCY